MLLCAFFSFYVLCTKNTKAQVSERRTNSIVKNLRDKKTISSSSNNYQHVSHQLFYPENSFLELLIGYANIGMRAYVCC